MSKIIKSLSILALSMLSMTTMSWANKSGFCSAKNTTVQAGEKLRYKVFYNLSSAWVGAGEATFTTKLDNVQGRPVYHITGYGATYNSYDWIFKVRDTYQTYIDTATMYPLHFKRNVNEGKTSFTNDVVFYQDIHKAVSKNKTYTVPECVQDVLSSIYYARNIDYSKYKVGDKIPFSLFLDDEIFEIYIRYLGKEKITTKYGQFNTIKIAPLLIEGTIFKGGEKMVVYVSDDKNKIPVRVDSPILVGSIKVDLIGYENLRHSLSSLIKKV